MNGFFRCQKCHGIWPAFKHEAILGSKCPSGYSSNHDLVWSHADPSINSAKFHPDIFKEHTPHYPHSMWGCKMCGKMYADPKSAKKHVLICAKHPKYWKPKNDIHYADVLPFPKCKEGHSLWPPHAYPGDTIDEKIMKTNEKAAKVMNVFGEYVTDTQQDFAPLPQEQAASPVEAKAPVPGDLSLHEAYDALKKHWESLPSGDHHFAKSMLKAYEQDGTVKGKQKHGSHSQQHWLKKMAKNALLAAGQIIPASIATTEKKTATVFSGFDKVYEMLQHASSTGQLKHPKIHLKLPNGEDLCLYLSGKNSKKPGVINLTNGKTFNDPQNKWYGRIYDNGSWEQPKAYAPMVQDGHDIVHTLLLELANNPVETAKKHGTLTGKCCFCNKKLTDPQSTAAGFGPVCAENFGLKVTYKKAEQYGATGTKMPNLQNLPKSGDSGVSLGQLLKNKIFPEGHKSFASQFPDKSGSMSQTNVTMKPWVKPSTKEEPRATAPKVAPDADNLLF